MFSPLQEDGGYTLRGGPVDALIAYAASSTKAGKRSPSCTYVHVAFAAVHVAGTEYMYNVTMCEEPS